MSNVHDDRPPTPTEDPLTTILGEIRTLGARFDTLEQRIGHLDASAPVRPQLVPSLALRSDGKVLLAVAHLEGADLAGRERWEGIVLSVPEASGVFKAMSDAADDAAGHTAGDILWQGKKREHDPGEGSGNDEEGLG
jgi:hypothetical protein